MSDSSPEEMIAQQKANCIFCKIISKEIPSQIPYEDEEFIAIMDIRPATKGHILLMPKEHYPILPVIPSDVSQKMFVIARKLLVAVQKANLAFKSNIFVANGAVAGQQSPHFLMHIMPRDNGDGIPLDNLSVKASSEEEKKLHLALTSRFKSPQAPRDNSDTKVRDPVSDLAEALEQNPEVKKLLIDDPEKFKDYVKANPQLEALFKNIDINMLSSKLKSLQKPHEERMSEAKKKDETEEVRKDEKNPEYNKEEETNSEKKADLDKISNLFK